MKHIPTITLDGRARCSCRAWVAPGIRDGETTGQYTVRAFAAHLIHANEFEAGDVAQRGLFAVARPEPEPASLFETVSL